MVTFWRRILHIVLGMVDVANDALSTDEHGINNVTIQHLSPVSEGTSGIQEVRMTCVWE